MSAGSWLRLIARQCILARQGSNDKKIYFLSQKQIVSSDRSSFCWSVIYPAAPIIMIFTQPSTSVTSVTQDHFHGSNSFFDIRFDTLLLLFLNSPMWKVGRMAKQWEAFEISKNRPRCRTRKTRRWSRPFWNTSLNRKIKTVSYVLNPLFPWNKSNTAAGWCCFGRPAKKYEDIGSADVAGRDNLYN